jgi:uncharacterized protein
MNAPRQGTRGAGQTGCMVGVRIKPGTSREKFVSVTDEGLCIAVTAAPVEGKANEALVRFLAKSLDVPKSSVTIRKGLTSRNKLVEIAGITKQEVLKRSKEITDK